MLTWQKSLVPVHSHPLALPTHAAIHRRTDGSAAALLAGHLCAALFEREQLLGAEGFVVDLRCRFDQVLEVGAGEEVAQVDEFAVALVFDVDGAPAVLAAAHDFAVDVDVALRADDGEGDDGL